MNVDQKLAAIRDLIQQDVGNRGLARDPEDNLINACPDDFEDACSLVAATPSPLVAVVTGFYIPTATPPASETDGPLGALFISRALASHGLRFKLLADGTAVPALAAGLAVTGLTGAIQVQELAQAEDAYAPGTWDRHEDMTKRMHEAGADNPAGDADQLLAIERVGPSYRDGRCYTMRGRDVTERTRPVEALFKWTLANRIGIGDGGNEIGMGKIPHETIVKNIPNGDLIHCRVPTDHLIVAGVSNWGAYALAAGIALLRGVELPDELFDPDCERRILQTMVDAGPLVDGVTGQRTATVDGLSWDDYIRPLVEIGKIVKA